MDKISSLFLDVEVARCDELLAEAMFSPEGGTITVSSVPGIYRKAYWWRSGNGCKVEVGWGSYFILSNTKHKEL
jgi:hypothetical protein